MNFQSPFLQEFFERGFFAQATHATELDDLLSREKITAYIGFDCTAKSLHAGSLIQIMILRLLQKHGHRPLVLLGGGTTKIGDPSGKDEARKMLSEENIQENLGGIRKTLERFISFSGLPSDSENNDLRLAAGDPRNAGRDSCRVQKTNAATLVNNDGWLKNLNYLDFLRDFGRHFSVNRMLTFDSVKVRLEREQPLSFLEFNYMILQAYDFFELNKNHGCRLQIGGSDQWGNIVNGVELIRRVSNKEAFGLTSPLLATADGKKMGKTADGAVWLDAEMLSPFDYFQYFRNTHDADVGKFLRLFTDLPMPEIVALVPGYPCLGGLGATASAGGTGLTPVTSEQGERVSGAMGVRNINEAKEILAFEATKICHGEKAASDARQKAREIFVAKSSAAFEEKKIFLGEDGSKKLVEIIKEIGAATSNSEAKKLIEGRGVKINDEVIVDVQFAVTAGEFNLSIGKKKFFRLSLSNPL